jgi:hypothetical protein
MVMVVFDRIFTLFDVQPLSLDLFSPKVQVGGHNHEGRLLVTFLWDYVATATPGITLSFCWLPYRREASEICVNLYAFASTFPPTTFLASPLGLSNHCHTLC